MKVILPKKHAKSISKKINKITDASEFKKSARARAYAESVLKRIFSKNLNKKIRDKKTLNIMLSLLSTEFNPESFVFELAKANNFSKEVVNKLLADFSLLYDNLVFDLKKVITVEDMPGHFLYNILMTANVNLYFARKVVKETSDLHLLEKKRK